MVRNGSLRAGIMAFTSPGKPFESPQARIWKNKTPGGGRGPRPTRPSGNRPPAGSCGRRGVARAGAAARLRRRPSGPGAFRGAGGLGELAWASEGAGLRGSGLVPAAPGRRADGVSRVTLRTPTLSGGGGNTYEPFGLLPGRAPGERPLLRASRFRRRVPGREESRPRGRRALGLFRNRFCLKFNTQDAEGKRSVTSVSLP